MLFKLMVFFTLVPLVELMILIEVGRRIGLLYTVVLVILTAFFGALLAKREGLSTLMRIRQNLSMGVVPGEELMEGVLILVAALLLVTPGLLTDCSGFLLLIRPVRRKLLKYLVSGLKRWTEGRRIHFH